MTSSRRMTRRAIRGAAVAGVAALVTACGTQTPGAAPAKTSTSPTTATPGKTPSSAPSSASPSGTTTATSRPASSPGPGPAGTAACASRHLRATAATAQGTAGSVYAVIAFTNLGSTSCTLYGYPGVSFVAGTPLRQVGLAAAENPGTPRQLVTLRPGGVASAQLQIVDAGNFSSGQCNRVTTSWVQIFPPNQTTQLYVHYTSATCAKPVRILTVGAVRPGSGG